MFTGHTLSVPFPRRITFFSVDITYNLFCRSYCGPGFWCMSSFCSVQTLERRWCLSSFRTGELVAALYALSCFAPRSLCSYDGPG